MGDNLFECLSHEASSHPLSLLIQHCSLSMFLLSLGLKQSFSSWVHRVLPSLGFPISLPIRKSLSSHGVYISVACSKLEYLFRYQLRIPTLSYASQHVPFCWMRPICLLSQPMMLQFGIDWGILSILGSLPVLSCVYRGLTLQYLPWLEVWTLFSTPLSHRAGTTLGSLFSSCNFGL